MNSQEKVLLYYVNAHTEPMGKYVVGRNHIASLLDVTTITAAKRMQSLIDYGYVRCEKKPLARGAGYKWVYYITPHGVNDCQAMWQEAFALYKAHTENRLIEAIKQATIVSKQRGKAIKRSEKQLSLFGDE